MGCGIVGRTSFISVALATVAALAACGGASSGASGSSASSPKPTPSAPAVVKTATATVAGKSETILTNPAGMTLYYYLPDKGGKVTCTGACAAKWPPLLLPSGVSKPSGTGLPGTLGTLDDPAGGKIVTYNNWPLYTWVNDHAPGDTTGQGVGGIWFVVTPDLSSG